MSHYYCSEHGDEPDSRCVICDVALEWQQKDATISSLQARIEALTEKYNDLLYQVQNKIPGESRHETAKRIIAQHESRRCDEGGETKMEGA